MSVRMCLMFVGRVFLLLLAHAHSPEQRAVKWLLLLLLLLLLCIGGVC